MLSSGMGQGVAFRLVCCFSHKIRWASNAADRFRTQILINRVQSYFGVRFQSAKLESRGISCLPMQLTHKAAIHLETCSGYFLSSQQVGCSTSVGYLNGWILARSHCGGFNNVSYQFLPGTLPLALRHQLLSKLLYCSCCCCCCYC